MIRQLALVVALAMGAFSWAHPASAKVNRRTFLTKVPQAQGQVKIAFFDADSTLRVSKSGTPSANGPDDYIILPNVAQRIQDLNGKGYLVMIVSNQGGVPQHISLEDADAAIYNMIQDLKQQGAIVHYYDFAENNDENRKPGIGMATRVIKKLEKKGLQYDQANSFMVGDSAYKRANPAKGIKADIRPDGREGFNFSNSDRLFAENAGLKFYEPQTYFWWEQFGVELIENKGDLERLLKAMEDAEEISISASF